MLGSEHVSDDEQGSAAELVVDRPGSYFAISAWNRWYLPPLRSDAKYSSQPSALSTGSPSLLAPFTVGSAPARVIAACTPNAIVLFQGDPIDQSPDADCAATTPPD